jgi:sugar lactone lactonase YvrE
VTTLPISRMMLIRLLFVAFCLSGMIAQAQIAHFGGAQTLVATGLPNATGSAVDANGNVYIADSSNNRILKETLSAGIYTQSILITGLNGPQRLVVDSAGNLYVLSPSADLLQKFTLVNGSYRGTTISTAFVIPDALALDSSGNIFVVDGTANKIYKFTFSNDSYIQSVAVTVAAGGIPSGVAIDAGGNLYISNISGKVDKATLSNGTYTVAPLITGLSLPVGVAIDPNGNLAIVANNSLIYEMLSGTTYTQTLLATNFNSPASVTFDSNGAIYITDTGNERVVKQTLTANFGSIAIGTTSAPQTLVFTFDVAGKLNGSAPAQALTMGVGGLDFADTGTGTCTASSSFPATASCTVIATFTPKLAGSRNGAIILNDNTGALAATGYITGTGLGPQIAFDPIQSTVGSDLNQPFGMAVDGNGSIYVAEFGNGTVVKETLAGGVYSQSVVVRGLNLPAYIAVDGAGNIYVSDPGTNRVVKETLSGGAYTQSTIGSGLITPVGVAVDGAGNLYITDIAFPRVVKEAPSGGGYIQTTVVDGIYDGAAADSAGNVYLADANNNRVLKETPSTGTYTQTIVANANGADGVAVDFGGNVYIANTGSSNILKETVSGGVYTESILATGLNGPQALAVDGSGNVYVSDNSNRLLVETVTTPPTLTFPSAAVGAASTAQVATLLNLGNQPLVVPAPATTSANPRISRDFTLQSTSATTCPVVLMGGTAGTLAANSSCTLSYEFTPTTAATLITENSLLTDNNLNLAGATQAITLSGSSTKGTETITFPQPPSPVVFATGETVALSASSSAGLAVTYTATGPATVHGSSITLTGIGSVEITANQNGSVNYSPATPVIDSINVTAEPATVYADPTTNIGSSSATQTVTLTFTAGANLAAIQVVTQGAPNLDFNFTSGGTCTAGTTYTANQTCTVNVVFSPKFAGTRYGAVVLNDASGNVVANDYLQGTGTGPQIAFAPPIQSIVATGLDTPAGVAVDGAGNVYIADSDHGRLLKEIPAGSAFTQTTIGTGLAVPFGVSVDGSGNVYIADVASGLVLKETLSGNTYIQTTVASGFDGPSGAAVDGAGNVYVADSNNNRVVKETLSGGVYTESIVVNDVATPQGVAVDGSGNVYITEANAQAFKETPSNGAYIETLIGSGIAFPLGIAVDGDGDVYIADGNSDRVYKETPSGNTYTQSVFLNYSTFAYYLAVDGAGNVYSSDPSNERVLLQNVSQPPSFTFNSTPTGASSAAQGATVTNLGNAPLSFLVPVTGLNPSTAPNFTLENNADTTCPVVNAVATAGTLAATASCSLRYVFTPTVIGTINGSSMISDNNLNVAAVTQTIQLSGTATQGTQTAQTITFPQPTQTIYPGTATLMATASSGQPVSYIVLSGSATVSGSTLTYTSPGTVVVQAMQAGNAQFSAAPPVSVTLNVTLAPSAIDWQPSTLKIFSGTALGSSVLDATDSQPSTIAYSAFLQTSGTPMTVTTSTVLPQGSYGLTATITPTDSTNYATTSITLLYTVQNMNVFIANNTGSVSSFFNNGGTQSGAASGGGIGAAVDPNGNFWSIDRTGSSISKFSDTGQFLSTMGGAGMNAAAAIAFDGSGTGWIANGNGSISAFDRFSKPVSSTPVASAANINAPASLTVDAAGSLWIANSGNNTVTEVIGVATPVTTPTVSNVINPPPTKP